MGFFEGTGSGGGGGEEGAGEGDGARLREGVGEGLGNGDELGLGEEDRLGLRLGCKLTAPDDGATESSFGDNLGLTTPLELSGTRDDTLADKMDRALGDTV